MADDLSEQVRGYWAGDPAAAEFLARRACRAALRTAAAVMQNREDAGDIAQDVTIDVLASLDRLRDPAAFDAWVHRITVRHVQRALTRRKRVRVSETALTPEGDHAVAEGPEQAGLLAARAALTSALAQLPARQRIAIALRYVHDMSDAQVAAALGCRLGTAHALLSRGRARLRRDPRLAEFAPATTAGGSM